MPTRLITDIDHYSVVLNLAALAKHSLWIGTADIKSLHMKAASGTKRFLAG